MAELFDDREGTLLRLGDNATAAALVRLGKDPRARRLRALASAGCPMRDAGARAIAGGAQLAGLVSLDVSSSKIGDAGLAALASSPALQQLETLDLRSNAFGIAGLRAVVAAFPKLRSLALDVDGVAQLRVLLDSELAQRLESLEISGSQLDDRAIARVAAASLGGLRRLSLYSNRIGAAGARALAKSRTLAGLTALELGHNHLGPEGTRAIATAKALAGLTELGVRSNQIGSAGLRAIATPRTLGQLVALDLSANQLRDADVATLAASTTLRALRELNLDWNPLGPGAARALAGMQLTTLVLSDPVDQYGDGECGIGDDGARALAASSHLKELRRLNLSQNGIRDDGARALAASKHLAKLEHVELKWNHIGKAGAAAIRKRFGKRASVAYQRTDSPPPPPPPPPEPNVATKPPTAADRRRVLRALAKRRAFAAWRPSIDKPIIAAAEAIARETAEALLALPQPTRAAERKILRRFVTRFDELDAADHFIGTIEVEDIGTRFDELRFATALADDDTLFDEWRDF